MTMQPLKAHVKNGRLVLDEPTDLPEGAEVELIAVVDGLEGHVPTESAGELARAWGAEIDRRASRVRAGASTGRAADEVLDRVEAKLRGR